MLFTFQAALWALQQPHKYSYSLQLAIHTQLHITTFNMIYDLFPFFFKSKMISSIAKYSAATSKHGNDTWKGH